MNGAQIFRQAAAYFPRASSRVCLQIRIASLPNLVAREMLEHSPCSRFRPFRAFQLTLLFLSGESQLLLQTHRVSPVRVRGKPFHPADCSVGYPVQPVAPAKANFLLPIRGLFANSGPNLPAPPVERSR